MSDIKKLLDIMNEMATVSGSVATVASPMGGTQRRTKQSKDSIFYEGDAVCHTCHQHECQCDANSRKAPESPEVANFGLWKNSILAGKEQKAKKKLKVKESVTDYDPKSQGGTRKELLAKLRSAKSAEEKSELATRARKAGASQKELQDLSEGDNQYGGQYDSKAEAIAYAKERVKSFRDPEDGIEIWALPSGGFDVVHTMNSNGRNHVVKNGGKKLGTVGQRYKGVAEGILGDIGNEIDHGIKGLRRKIQGKPSRRDVKDKYLDRAVSARQSGNDSEADKNADRWKKVIDKTNSGMMEEQGVAEGSYLGKTVDMKDEQCTACKKGTYRQTGYHDDMDGVLHCTNPKCRKQVKRHQPIVAKKKVGVSEAYDDSMTDAEWEREYQREKSEKEQARKEIEKNHVSQFKTKDDAVKYANDKLKTFKDSSIGMSVYSMPDGGFDVCSTARTAAGEKRRKLISDAGGKHLGTLGPRYTKHKMKEGSRDPWKEKEFGPTTVIKKIFKIKIQDEDSNVKAFNVKAETEQQAREVIEKHVPGAEILDVKFVKNLMAETESESWSIRFMDGGKEDKMIVKAASNREALKKWRAKKPDAEIIGISRAKTVQEDAASLVSTLQSAWSEIDRVDPDSPHYKKLVELLNSLPQSTLKELVDAKIKFVSGLARNRLKKSIEESSDERLADLSKISTAKLQELVSLHRHAGGNNPLAAKAARRGAEELLKRGIRVPVDEAKESDELASDLTQRNLKKMAARHGDEQWTLEQLKKLGEKLAAASKKTKRVDELGNSLMPGGQRAVNLAEQDFILNPHDVRRISREVVPKVDPRQDHEVEMACSDLFQAAKNAREVLQLIKDIPESVGLEGWVQEKIIKASDYLNTVREYLEGQQVRSAMSGNFDMGNMLDESADNPLEAALVRRIMSQHTDVLQQYGPKNVLAAISDVAREFSPDDELGTSDVSAYVKQVLSYLHNYVGDQIDEEDHPDVAKMKKHLSDNPFTITPPAGIKKLIKPDEEKKSTDESVAATLMTAAAAGAGGILANKIIAMIDDARDRVKDMKEKRRLEAELNKVEKYLDSSQPMAESKIGKTRK